MHTFAHLHVASAFSLRYGASTPEALVARAAEQGQSALALTDRDGVYGAVRFAVACAEAGLQPILGVDLAVLTPWGGDATRAMPPAPRRTPVKGGAWVDPRHPRAVLIARDKRGWASLCRLISQVHADRDGAPVATFDQVAAHADGVIALLGPESPVVAALAVRRPDDADALVRPWREAFGHDLRMEVVTHRAHGGPLSTNVAARVLGWARERAITPVLAHAVRYADPQQARVIDVLDSARRLVPLDGRHRDRPNAEGHLASTPAMAARAEEIARAAGLERSAADALLAESGLIAQACALDPAADLGIGEIFVPEDRVVLGAGAPPADAALRARCEAGLSRYRGAQAIQARDRLDAELRTIAHLGFATYFLTVAEVVDLTRNLGIRVAARGSGAGSLINHLLGISGVDPIRHGLLMERFLTTLRRALPDIDIDVESARRTEVYDAILRRFGTERVACVSMMETYRVRHAIRDVGAALGMPMGEIDALAKSFPHIRARDARSALQDLPELRTSGLGRLTARGELESFWDLVEGLDGLPRHVALHPCGVLLSDATLLDRTPVEPSAQGYPMSQFDKDDVEELGLLKLDVLGIRMQSALAHAVDEVARVDHTRIDLDAVPMDDPATFALVQSARTLGCFQIESPGQRELIGKFAPETFEDLIIDISLFRPGPVKSDMVTPFLKARQGWCAPAYVHDDLRPALAETYGVVVFHEQVLRVVATMTGCSLAEADETRRSMGSPEGQDDVRAWFYPAALRKGYDLETVERVWEVLRAFASFGFCKAHAAAFALPTYQSAWFKAHHPAAFLAGVLTHDPGMYPKRLIVDDARNHGIAILGLDVNRSGTTYRVERVDLDVSDNDVSDNDVSDNDVSDNDVSASEGSSYGIRLSLTDVKGMSEAEADSIVAHQPYTSLGDFSQRSGASAPIVERLILAGGFDSLYGIHPDAPRRRGQVTRRDLLLQASDLVRARGRGSRGRDRGTSGAAQLSFDLVDATAPPVVTGLPEMTPAERVRAELEILGLDVSRHVIDFYAPMLDQLRSGHPALVRARDLLGCRSQAEILVAGVKVATQTPPMRSGRRVVFITLDDATGPIDATFFEDAQGPYAATIFQSWLLLVRGEVRRTGPRGVSLRATGAWDLGYVHDAWSAGGVGAVVDMVADSPRPERDERKRRVLVHASGFRQSPYADVKPAGGDVRSAPAKLWHSSPGSSGW